MTLTIRLPSWVIRIIFIATRQRKKKNTLSADWFLCGIFFDRENKGDMFPWKVYRPASFAWHLFHADFLLDVSFNPENGGDIPPKRWLTLKRPHVLYPRIQNSSRRYTFGLRENMSLSGVSANMFSIHQMTIISSLLHTHLSQHPKQCWPGRTLSFSA
jgi:hypothetical protein